MLKQRFSVHKSLWDWCNLKRKKHVKYTCYLNLTVKNFFQKFRLQVQQKEMGNQNCSKNALKKQLNNFTCNWCKQRVKLVFEARTRVTRQFSHFDRCFTQPHVYGDIQAAFLCIRSGNCIFIRQAAWAKGTAKILLVAQLRKHHKLQTRNSKMQIAQYKFGGALINSTGKQLFQILYACF